MMFSKKIATGILATLAALTATMAEVASAAPTRDAKNVVLKIEPIKTGDFEKKQEARMSAVNRALEQSLTERAKSQSSFERSAKRAERLEIREQPGSSRAIDARAARAMDLRLDSNSREVRAMNRDTREETRREKRLNWLND